MRLREGRREAVLVFRYDGVDPDLLRILFLEERGDSQYGFDGPGILRGADDHGLAGLHGALLNGSRIGDIHRAADDPEILRDIHVVFDLLLHLLPLHVFRHDDAEGIAGSRQDQLLDQGIFPGVKTKDHNVSRFQDQGVAPLQIADLFLDGAGDNANEHAGKQHARHRDERHKGEITRAAVLKGGHPGIDDSGDAVPDDRRPLSFLAEAQQDDES